MITKYFNLGKSNLNIDQIFLNQTCQKNFLTIHIKEILVLLTKNAKI